jgi:uncharacterized protein
VDEDEGLRFSLDNSVGRLARWLRLLGHDAAWSRGDRLDDALARARDEGRFVLTRSGEVRKHRLVLPPSGGMVLASDALIEQMVELGRSCPIFSRSRPFSRCADCNAALVPTPLEEVRDRVPEFVAGTQTGFRSCPQCRRVFWNATHSAAIVRTLDEAARRCGQILSFAQPENIGAGPDDSSPAPHE